MCSPCHTGMRVTFGPNEDCTAASWGRCGYPAVRRVMNPRSTKTATQQGCSPTPSVDGLQSAWCGLLQLSVLFIAATALGSIHLVVAVVAVLARLLLQQQSTQQREHCTSQQRMCTAGGTPQCMGADDGLSLSSAKLLSPINYMWLHQSTHWALGQRRQHSTLAAVGARTDITLQHHLRSGQEHPLRCTSRTAAAVLLQA